MNRNCGCCLQDMLFCWNIIIIMIFIISMVSLTTTIRSNIPWWWQCYVRSYFRIHCAERCLSCALPPCHVEGVSIVMNTAAATKIENLFLGGLTSFCVVNSLNLILTWLTSKKFTMFMNLVDKFCFLDPASVINARLDICLFQKKNRKINYPQPIIW